MKGKKRSYKYLIISCLSVMTVLFVWWLLIDVFHVKRQNVFPGPIKVFNGFITKLYTKKPDGATLIEHLASSMRVALTGYGFGVLIGVPLGVMMAWNRWFEMFTRPLFDLLKPIPGVAWIPLMILILGIGLESKATVIAIASMIACTINAYTGIRQTKEVHLWVGDTFGASRWQQLYKIALPTALPMIFTGMRIALGTAWTALIAAELLASTRGLGYMIQQSRATARPDLIIVGMITIGIVGAVLDRILFFIERLVAKGMNAR